MPDISADKLVATYVKIRDRRAEIQREWEKEDKRLEDQLELVTNKLLDICRETGVESMRTNAGTVTRSVKTRYWTSDWSSFYEFVREHDALNLLEQRIHQGNFKQLMVETDNKIPKGVNVDSRYTIRVVRAR